jgi:hypothetical protein
MPIAPTADLGREPSAWQRRCAGRSSTGPAASCCPAVAAATVCNGAGTYRHATAFKAGLEQVPCWVVDLDDEAYLELVRANMQGELTPLERGMHFNGSGLGSTEYARTVGLAHAQVTYDGIAARVYAAVVSQLTPEQAADLRTGRNQHLYEIGKTAPEWLRPALVEELLARGWTVETARGKAKTLAEVEPSLSFMDRRAVPASAAAVARSG